MKGIAILVIFYWAGVRLEDWLHLPLPGNIVGLLLLLTALKMKLVKLEWTASSAQLGLRHMGLFFIPAIVGASVLLPQFAEDWLPIGVGLVVSTLIVMAVTGLVTKYWRRKELKPDAPR